MSEEQETMAEYIFKKSSRISMPSYSGIYFLLDNAEVVYVGQSRNIINRINQHIKEKQKEFNRYWCVPSNQDQLDDWEAYFILELSPKYNKALPKNITFFQAENAAEICEVSIQFLQDAVNSGKMRSYEFKGNALFDIDQIVDIRDGTL